MVSPVDYRAITIAYADIFNYPLTSSELRLWCIKKSIQSSEYLSNKHYFLKGRGNLVGLRKKRHISSLKKWRIAMNVGWLLRIVPTIQLVGVTGGLAMNNAHADDDIDIFIITSSNTLWTTRLFSALIVDFLGRRRKPGVTAVANKVCLNMFMSEDALRIAKKEQDLFTAHEVLQMVPLWQRHDMYGKFLAKNAWVEHFLPNAWKQKAKSESSRFIIHNSLFSFIEPLAKMAQLWYMRHHRTTEVINDSVLRFHPRDARVWVKEELQKRLDRLNIPLDKIFYRG